MPCMVLHMKAAEPLTALERMQASRARTSNAYSKARNAAEREVEKLIRDKHPSIYHSMCTAVDAEAPDLPRGTKQTRVRSGCAQWFRSQHRAEWERMLDAQVALATEGTDVVITRRGPVT